MVSAIAQVTQVTTRWKNQTQQNRNAELEWKRTSLPRAQASPRLSVLGAKFANVDSVPLRSCVLFFKCINAEVNKTFCLFSIKK